VERDRGPVIGQTAECVGGGFLTENVAQPLHLVLSYDGLVVMIQFPDNEMTNGCRKIANLEIPVREQALIACFPGYAQDYSVTK
jgi:hypothetical protein